MMSADCPFCAGNLTRATVAETAHCRTLYNVAPLVPGHCLIVPKRHVTRLIELGAVERDELFRCAPRMAELLMQVYGCDGYDLSMQQGASAGQTVMHLHLHIVPRRPDDLPSSNWHDQLLDSASRPRLTSEELAGEVVKLRRALGGDLT